MEAGRTPVVFVHGLWLHADSWSPWVDAFMEAGYSASAVGWPGDAAMVAETRADPDRVAGHGLADLVAHVFYAAQIQLPIAAAGSSHRNERNLGLLNGQLHIAGGAQQARSMCSGR